MAAPLPEMPMQLFFINVLLLCNTVDARVAFFMHVGLECSAVSHSANCFRPSREGGALEHTPRASVGSTGLHKSFTGVSDSFSCVVGSSVFICSVGEEATSCLAW